MLSNIYPQYQDAVDFYAVGLYPGESLSQLEQAKETRGYPWPVAVAAAGMLPDYRVLTQSTKVAIDGKGVITFRAGYGQGGPDTWHQVFLHLASNEGEPLHVEQPLVEQPFTDYN